VILAFEFLDASLMLQHLLSEMTCAGIRERDVPHRARNVIESSDLTLVALSHAGERSRPRVADEETLICRGGRCVAWRVRRDLVMAMPWLAELCTCEAWIGQCATAASR